MDENKIKQVNWYEANIENCGVCENNVCPCECPCNCSCNTYIKNCSKSKNKKQKNKALSYVFKQQAYYVRCVDGQKFNWVPLIKTNGEVLVNQQKNTQLSSLFLTDIVNAVPITTLPNQYPDYSGVDVGQGIKWPKKVFAPYVDSTAWPPFKFADLFATTKVPFYNLGFIVSENPQLCFPSWGGFYPAQSGPLNDQIKALRALGGDVTVSFGGAANVPLYITAPDINTLKEQYKRFIIAYGLTRIDFDIEGIWIDQSYEQANKNNSQALKILQDELAALGKSIDIWFTLPVLPTGLTNDGIRILQLALDAGVVITGVNVMTMDYGDSEAPNPAGKMGQYGIQAITSLKNQLNVLYKGSKTEAELWAMIGITPMLGVNDVSDEIFRQSDANQTLNFAKSKNIGMISMWSANRDNSAGSGIAQTDNEFSLIFNAYNM